MKNNSIGVILFVLVLLSSLLISCGEDVIFDTTQLPTDSIPSNNTTVDPASLPSNQAPGNTEKNGRPPLFVSQAITRVVENRDYSYTVKVDDPDFGDTLVVTALKLPSWLELTKQDDNNTVLIGKPENKHIGGHLVELVVTDSKGLQSKQVFYVYVIDATANNNPPTASNQSINTREDEVLKLVLQAEDADGDNLSYTFISLPKHGELSGQAPNLRYTPALNRSGTDSFTYKVSDGKVESKEATVNLRIIALNDAPKAQAVEITIDKNKTTEVILPAQDVETKILSYSIVDKPSFGTLSALYGNKLSYTPKENFIGEDSFSFKASDGQFSSNTAKITIKIEDPVILPPKVDPPTPDPEPENSKYRIIVTADVGWDPDDMQSIYRLIHYSDIFDVEGLIASVSADGFDPNPTLLRETIRNVQVDSLRAKGYTELLSEAELLSRVSVGKGFKAAPKAGDASEGSNQIIEQVRLGRERGDNRPLWVLVWGPMTDIAQALHDDPSIASSIRIISIGNVNSDMDLGSRDYVFNFMKNRVPGLFWIDNSSRVGFRRSYEGIFRGGNQSGEWSSQNFIDANIRGHGTAGDKFPLAYGNIGLKEGDSITLLYFISPEFGTVGDVNNPTAESWAGEYKRYNNAYPNYYIDCCESETAAKESISKWRVQYLSHWKDRWDRYK